MSSPLPEIDFSIIICTCGRSKLLRDAIASIVVQSVSPDRYEIVVVDDNAKDDTPEVTAELAQQYPQVRYVKNDGRGLLRARFTGQGVAKGRYTAYLDDDAKACPQWLEIASRIVRDQSPVCFGGPFFPFYVSKKPNWYKDEYGAMTKGHSARNLEPDEVLCGGNIFFETDAMRVSGGFDADFCAPGERWTYGDEEVPQARLRACFPDREFFYDPDLYILHLVRPERLSIVRAARECFAMGRAFAKVNHESDADQRALPFARRFLGSCAAFLAKALVVSHFRDRGKYRYPQNYIYEVAFSDLRRAGVFLQRCKQTSAAMTYRDKGEFA